MLVVAVVVVRVVSNRGAGSVTSRAAGLVSSLRPCTGRTPPARWQHVIWLWMEDQTYAATTDPVQASFENTLVARCGVATDYHGLYHDVSLPNYMGATSGQTQGDYFGNDAGPDQDPNEAASIFAQLTSARLSWKVYAEAMPSNCYASDSGTYAVRHNPAPYYTAIAGDCATDDVPLGDATHGALVDDLTARRLPTFSFIAPDLCHDTHDCSVATGDRWLAQLVPMILASPTYQDGRTLLVITHDDSGHGAQPVETIVIAPSVIPGTRSTQRFDHYALLRTTEDIFGLGHLGSAASAPSMRAAFHL